MKRRQFIRVIGGVALTSAVAPGYAFGAQDQEMDSEGVLVEASSFAHRGGWVLDTQHFQQMGGCYLLAHGMGSPVENARTRVALPAPGEWYVWVRTRNWQPGNWAAPGRFKVLINGKPLAAEFGVEDGWTWQNGGGFQLPQAGEVAVELQDLTGFEGRCDGIYFSRRTSPKLPNDDLKELGGWKDRVTGRAVLQIEEQNFDLVIVGGGIAGCAAALAARSRGLNVALIQDRPVLGGNASEEIRVHTEGISGKGDEIIKRLDTKPWPNGSPEAGADQKKREAAMAGSGARIFASHLCCGLEKAGGRIASIEARGTTTGLLRRFRAPLFIDATGDGWLGCWSGADYRYGREAHSEFGEARAEYGDLWSPENPDHKVMGATVLWDSDESDRPSGFPDVPWAMPVAKTNAAIKGVWQWEFSADHLHQVDDAEQIRDHLLCAIYGSFANAKKDLKNKNRVLTWVSFLSGKRESRRLMGDYIYTFRDMVYRRRFPDTVVEERRNVDVHHQLAEIGNQLDFLADAIYKPTLGLYYVPFRSLYSHNIENLMMAGRCFSCSHIGLGGPRVMRTCGQMGIAVGYAASLCLKHGATPREVGKDHIKELRGLIGYE